MVLSAPLPKPVISTSARGTEHVMTFDFDFLDDLVDGAFDTADGADEPDETVNATEESVDSNDE